MKYTARITRSSQHMKTRKCLWHLVANKVLTHDNAKVMTLSSCQGVLQQLVNGFIQASVSCSLLMRATVVQMSIAYCNRALAQKACDLRKGD